VTLPVALSSAVALILSFGGSLILIRYLSSRNLLDAVNDRSSHETPKPRGGGIAIVLAITIAMLLAAFLSDAVPANVLFALLPFCALAMLSWRDDRAPLPWRFRLLVHAGAVAVGLMLLLESNAAAPMALLALPVLFLVWLWFVNAYNFMDGIDGMAAIEAISIGLGLALCGWLTDASLIAAGMIGAASAAGFLLVNWAPSRIFMGDVGSIALGWLFGFLLCGLALQGYWAAALTLPAYFLADATLTLLKRLWRGENITEAHRSHWYQQAAGKKPEGHRRVMFVVIGCNMILIAVAAFSTTSTAFFVQAASLAAAAIVALATLTLLSRLARMI
jgi:UDP-N-acetylmuramyl pentapeptide phosphotransferase/UDP-N-acetylglucosamine-1-phosphate transferase